MRKNETFLGLLSPAMENTSVQQVSRKYGFTLVELLISILIIGILMAALIPKLRGLQTKADATDAQVAMKTIGTWIFQAELNTNMLLKDITGNYCTEHSCRSVSGPLENIATTHTCRTNWQNAITIIAIAAGETREKDFFTDPRGAPYLLDENEGEISATDCRFDSLQSAGPDGVWLYDNNLYPEQNDIRSNDIKNKDNIMGALRPLRCTGTY